MRNPYGLEAVDGEVEKPFLAKLLDKYSRVISFLLSSAAILGAVFHQEIFDEVSDLSEEAAIRTQLVVNGVDVKNTDWTEPMQQKRMVYLNELYEELMEEGKVKSTSFKKLRFTLDRGSGKISEKDADRAEKNYELLRSSIANSVDRSDPFEVLEAVSHLDSVQNDSQDVLLKVLAGDTGEGICETDADLRMILFEDVYIGSTPVEFYHQVFSEHVEFVVKIGEIYYWPSGGKVFKLSDSYKAGSYFIDPYYSTLYRAFKAYGFDVESIEIEELLKVHGNLESEELVSVASDIADPNSERYLEENMNGDLGVRALKPFPYAASPDAEPDTRYAGFYSDLNDGHVGLSRIVSSDSNVEAGEACLTSLEYGGNLVYGDAMEQARRYICNKNLPITRLTDESLEYLIQNLGGTELTLMVDTLTPGQAKRISATFTWKVFLPAWLPSSEPDMEALRELKVARLSLGKITKLDGRILENIPSEVTTLYLYGVKSVDFGGVHSLGRLSANVHLGVSFSSDSLNQSILDLCVQYNNIGFFDFSFKDKKTAELYKYYFESLLTSRQSRQFRSGGALEMLTRPFKRDSSFLINARYLNALLVKHFFQSAEVYGQGVSVDPNDTSPNPLKIPFLAQSPDFFNVRFDALVSLDLETAVELSRCSDYYHLFSIPSLTSIDMEVWKEIKNWKFEEVKFGSNIEIDADICELLVDSKVQRFAFDVTTFTPECAQVWLSAESPPDLSFYGDPKDIDPQAFALLAEMGEKINLHLQDSLIAEPLLSLKEFTGGLTVYHEGGDLRGQATSVAERTALSKEYPLYHHQESRKTYYAQQFSLEAAGILSQFDASSIDLWGYRDVPLLAAERLASMPFLKTIFTHDMDYVSKDLVHTFTGGGVVFMVSDNDPRAFYRETNSFDPRFTKEELDFIQDYR